MDFETAVKYLKQGEKIKRGKWRNAYLMIEDQKLKMSLGRERAWSYSFRNDDLFSTDWGIRNE